jgi:DNA-binding NarL/FixJ family response regulator
MNVLLVTPNRQDAGFIENELAKRIPDLHVHVAREVELAIQHLASPGGFSAVLLDATLSDGDPAAVIRAAREQNSPVAVIGLVADAELNSGIKLLESGADNFVIKGEGFADGLAAVLPRGSASAPRVLYAAGSTDSAAALARASLKRNTAGATRVLIRNDESEAGGPYSTAVDASLMQRLHQAEILSRQMEKEVQAEAYWPLEHELSELEQRQNRAEDKHTRLQPAFQQTEGERSRFLQSDTGQVPSAAGYANQPGTAEVQREDLHRERRVDEPPTAEMPAGDDFANRLESAEKEKERLLNLVQRLEVRIAGKTEELRREREQWNLFRGALNQKLASIESRHAGLERVVAEEKQRQQKLLVQHSAEMSRSENARLELEKRFQGATEENARLHDSLKAAESKIAGSIEQHRVKTERLESARLAMEQQSRELQEEIARLEEANRMLSVERDGLLAQLETVRLEHENQTDALAGELSLIIEKHNQAVEKYRAKLAEFEPLLDTLAEKLKPAGRKPRDIGLE